MYHPPYRYLVSTLGTIGPTFAGDVSVPTDEWGQLNNLLFIYQIDLIKDLYQSAASQLGGCEYCNTYNDDEF